MRGVIGAVSNVDVLAPPPPSTVTVSFNPSTVLPGGQTTVTVSTQPSVAYRPVTLTPAEVANSGGHNHTGRPLSTWYASPVGTTNAAGQFQITYTASSFGGAERITANIDGVNGNGTLNVAVQGLVALGPGSNYVLTGTTPYHVAPANRFGTPTANANLVSIANQYAAQYPGSVLWYNDQSLSQGGIFDIGPPDGPLWSPPHAEHRFGINCDVSKSNVPSARWVDVRDIFVQFGSSNYLEHGNHWHLRFQ